MKHHYSAIELNHSGICSLLQHKYEEAAGHFRHALLASKEDVRYQQAHCDSKLLCSAAAQEEMPYESIEFYESSRINVNFDRIGFRDPMICKMAINIPNEGITSTSKSFASAVIYNLAITAHLWGLQSGSNAHLQTALSLYEMVYRIYQRDDAAPGPNTINVVTAVLNNVASIYAVMGNDEHAATFLQQLLAIMIYCCVPGTTSTKCGHSWKICLKNALTQLVGPPSTAGAA